MDHIPVWNKCFNMNCNVDKLTDSLSIKNNAVLFYCIFLKKSQSESQSQSPLNRVCSIKHIGGLIYNYARDKSGSSQVIDFILNKPNFAFKCYFCSKHLKTFDELNAIVNIIKEEATFTIEETEMKAQGIEVHNIFPFRKKLISANVFNFSYYNFSKSSGEQFGSDLWKSCPQFALLINVIQMTIRKLEDLLV